MLTTVVLSLTAAVAFGWSVAGMHAGASAMPEQVGGRPLAVLGHLIRQPRWLTGFVASLLGLVLHSLALRSGSLAIVQPLVVTSLVFTFVFRAVLHRSLPGRRVVGLTALTAAGLGVFLVAAQSATGATRPDGVAAGLVLLTGGTAAALCWRAARGAAPNRAGLLLGTAAGLVFGMVAGTLKATATAPSITAAATSWPLYMLLVLGAAGFTLNQTAYRIAPLTSSVPVLNLVNPLVALCYGIVAFQERPAHGLGSVVAEALSLPIVLTGVFLLARESEPSLAAEGTAAPPVRLHPEPAPPPGRPVRNLIRDDA